MSWPPSPYLSDMPGYSVRQGGGTLAVSPRLGRQSGPALVAYHRRRLAYHARTIGDQHRRAAITATPHRDRRV